MVYHQYIFLHTPHSTVFLTHFQTRGFLGVLWQYLHQATVSVRLGLQDPLLQKLEDNQQRRQEQQEEPQSETGLAGMGSTPALKKGFKYKNIHRWLLMAGSLLLGELTWDLIVIMTCWVMNIHICKQSKHMQDLCIFCNVRYTQKSCHSCRSNQIRRRRHYLVHKGGSKEGERMGHWSGSKDLNSCIPVPGDAARQEKPTLPDKPNCHIWETLVHPRCLHRAGRYVSSLAGCPQPIKWQWESGQDTHPTVPKMTPDTSGLSSWVPAYTLIWWRAELLSAPMPALSVRHLHSHTCI